MSKMSSKAKNKTPFFTKRSMIGYVAGGGAYFWSAWLIITFGTQYIGLWWANIIGNTIGVLLNYLAQRFWAFPGKNIFNSGVKFITLTLFNFLISFGILKLLNENFGVPLWFAQFISAGFFTFWNYIWYKLWVFKDE
ncbi:GtrA family protein [Candidatus Saccharibacteria bacterium]|nr:GtrA family protein [Candidatus Saccharibacteria bacterium]